MQVLSLDPNVQVAFVSVFATTITTLGLIIVAIVNNRKERGKSASEGVEAALDERDILERMLSLIAENDRKEVTIKSLRKKILDLQDHNRSLMRENTALRLRLPQEDEDP